MRARLSRRDLVKSAALAASGAWLCGTDSAQAAPTRETGPLHLGLMTYNLAKDWDIDTIIKNCTEAKFEHVELRTTHAHKVEVDLTPAERAKVKRRFQDSPLRGISLASAFAYHYDDPQVVRRNIEGTKQYVRLAQDIGAIGIRVFPNSLMVDKGIPEETTLRQIGESLAEVGEFAHDRGVEIRIAVHGRGTDQVPRVKKMLDYSGSDHVYVNWNCSPNDVKGRGLEANFAMVASRIRGIHLHELYNQQYPYRELFRLLRESGYQGYCNAEISESPEPVRLMKYYRALFLAYQDPA